MSGSLGDDLRAFLAGLGQLVDGVERVESSASSAAKRIKNIPGRVGEAVDRVVEASIEAGANAAIDAGRRALETEMRRPLGIEPTSGPSAPPEGWRPAYGCTHEGTCKHANPWKCHQDSLRAPPDGSRGPNGETRAWYCDCEPCHDPHPAAHRIAVCDACLATHHTACSGKTKHGDVCLCVCREARASQSVAAHATGHPAPSASAPSAAPIPAPGTRTTSCDTHGTNLWNGHLMCRNCRRIYQTLDPRAERSAPDVCVCSSNLLPRAREPFAGRPLCQLCFLANLKSGRMP